MYVAPSSPRAEVVMRARRSPPRARIAFLRASARAFGESAMDGEVEVEVEVDVEEREYGVPVPPSRLPRVDPNMGV